MGIYSILGREKSIKGPIRDGPDLFLLTEGVQTSNLLLIKPLPERASQVLDRSGLYLRGAYSPYEERGSRWMRAEIEKKNRRYVSLGDGFYRQGL